MAANSDPKSVLLEINTTIAPLEAETTIRKRVIESVKSRIVEELKKDDLFKLLFREVHHCRSVYDGLHCGSDYDFDLNLTLTIEEIQSMLKFVEKNEHAPGFLQLELTTDRLSSTKPNWIHQWNNFLQNLTWQDTTTKRRWIDPTLMCRWFQGIVDKSNIKNLTDSNVTRILVSGSGRARKLKIYSKALADPIDVDLVPVFEFMPMAALGKINDVLSRNNGLQDRFFLIPKPLRHVNVANAERMWRLDFHKLEMRILSGYQKTIIRLLKTFRNGNAGKGVGRNHCMSGLTSYSLKTLVLLMTRDRRDLEWKEQNGPKLFLEALKSLHNRLMNERKIPYYFDPDCNLLWNMDQTHIVSMAGWLGPAIKKMEESMGTNSCRAVWRQQFGLD